MLRKKHAGKVVVVTGASAGVGRAIVREFARDGAKLGLLARGRDGLEAARREVERLGSEALVLPTDVADFKQVDFAADEVVRQFGHIDIWVNVAMTSVFSPVAEMKADEYKRVTEVTYLGYVYGTMAALKHMRARDRGLVIQIGSALAYRSIPLQSAYCASKAAIVAFTESLNSELIHEQSGIKTSMIHLPAVNTPQFGWVRSRLPNKAQPMPPIFQPEVIANAVSRIAARPRREVYLGFPTVKAIWADKLVPGIADRYLATKGYTGQQTDEPRDPNRPDNLWSPVPGDHGAHGAFDERARSLSPHIWMNTHRTWLALAAFAAVTLSTALKKGAFSRGRPVRTAEKERRYVA